MFFEDTLLVESVHSLPLEGVDVLDDSLRDVGDLALLGLDLTFYAFFLFDLLVLSFHFPHFGQLLGPTRVGLLVTSFTVPLDVVAYFEGLTHDTDTPVEVARHASFSLQFQNELEG